MIVHTHECWLVKKVHHAYMSRHKDKQGHPFLTATSTLETLKYQATEGLMSMLLAI